MNNKLDTLKNKNIFFILYFLFLLISLILIFVEEKGYGILFFDKHRTRFLNIFFEIITKLGEFYVFLFFIIYYYKKDKKIYYSIATLGLLIPGISYGLKSLFKYPRPITYFYKYLKNVDFEGIENAHYHTGNNSFPSGHTFAAFAIFTFLALTSKSNKKQIIYFSIAAMVGLSRIYLAQHFIEDVAFGSFLGIILALLIYFFVYKYRIT